jgi:hypothetical protein
MAFVQFTQPDNQPVVINTERIVTAAPMPPDGVGTRITFSNGGYRDVKELITDVLRRLNCMPIGVQTHADPQPDSSQQPDEANKTNPDRLATPKPSNQKEDTVSTKTPSSTAYSCPCLQAPFPA